MFRSLQTRESWPSLVRNRLTPPTSTPSVVESMKVVSLRSTTTSRPPWSITSSSCCLNSGAVYRSTSPAREITYCSSLSFSVLTSKFMFAPGLAHPAVAAGLMSTARSRNRLSLTGCRRVLRRLQLLDLLLDDRRARIVRRELDELLVGGDRLRVVAALLGGLRQLELHVRVVRSNVDEPLVCRLRLLERGLR